MHIAGDSHSEVYQQCFAYARRLIRDEGCRRVEDHNAGVFENSESLAARLLVHSVNEAVGAAVLKRVAKHHDGSEDSVLLGRHARDEARHSKLLAQASADILPGVIRSHTHVRARAASEIAGYDGNLMNFYCATHVAEIRNLFVLDQYISLARHLAQPISNSLVTLFASILADEGRHVAYTRGRIEPWLNSEANAANTFRQYCEIHRELVLDPIRELQGS